MQNCVLSSEFSIPYESTIKISKKMQAKGYHNEEKEMCWWLFYKNNSQTNSLSYPEEPLRKLIPIISSSTSIHNETFSSRRPWLLTSCLHDHAIQIHQIEQLIMVRSRACPVQHKWLWLHYGSGSQNSSGYFRTSLVYQFHSYHNSFSLGKIIISPWLFWFTKWQ